MNQPDWKSVCSLLAGASGLMHDLGKFSLLFQRKLHSLTPKADLVRHEWISLHVVRDLLAGLSWEESWQKHAGTKTSDRWKAVAPFDKELAGARQSLLYMIATHHRLPEIRNNLINWNNHVREREPSGPDDNLSNPYEVAIPVTSPSPENMARITAMLDEISNLPVMTPRYWRAASTFARIALILADHAVSTVVVTPTKADAYANTLRGDGARVFNQPLDWHLENVCTHAQHVMQQIPELAPPALPGALVDRLCAPVAAPGSRFYWQEIAFQALDRARAESDLPFLVLNMAGTGSGKTRMNVRAACAIGDRAGAGIRFATALNLRSLTLQTGDAYAEQLRIPSNQMSCVIGDKLTLALHDYQKSLQRSQDAMLATTRASLDPEKVAEHMAENEIVDDDENPPEAHFETVSGFAYDTAPAWLAEFLERDPKMAAVIGAPILVSTIDFLIAAGEPQRQGNHALASLRVMTSDLILDEIDGYDPKALIAVMRLVTSTALYGRNVIASSATLSPEVAKLIWNAYNTGIQMRADLTGCANRFNVGLIDDATAPLVNAYPALELFMAAYADHSNTMLATLHGKRHRVPYLQRIESKNIAGMLDAILTATSTLHENQRLQVPSDLTGNGIDHHVSFGLVRIANIVQAVKVAAHLAAKLPNARVVCYHANHFPIQRFHIERELDTLLRRDKSDAHLWEHPEVVAAVKANQAAGYADTLFIVVATPVEEIGRDHDFDWAVIEPSSTQSIVQTAGRVNRHRQLTVRAPNIALLQFNFRTIAGKKGEEQVFVKPGLETGTSHPEHDLEVLLDWKNGIEQVDARLRLDHRHKFAKYDDAALQEHTGRIARLFTGGATAGKHWMGKETYTKFPLREMTGPKIELALISSDNPASYDVGEQFSNEAPLQRNLTKISAPMKNAWLIKTDSELKEMAQQAGVRFDRAMTVATDGPFMRKATSTPKLARHLSFGFYNDE